MKWLWRYDATDVELVVEMERQTSIPTDTATVSLLQVLLSGQSRSLPVLTSSRKAQLAVIHDGRSDRYAVVGKRR
jgi:hypothetical protein